jgi:hypothetical protein
LTYIKSDTGAQTTGKAIIPVAKAVDWDEVFYMIKLVHEIGMSWNLKMSEMFFFVFFTFDLHKIAHSSLSFLANKLCEIFMQIKSSKTYQYKTHLENKFKIKGSKTKFLLH